MKNVKQIRESYDLITEKEENEERKLNALVRAGLYDAKKLPALKKALDKSADKITPQEKRMLINLLDTLLSQVLSNQQVYMKVKQNVQQDIKEAAKPEYLSKADPRFSKKFPSDKDIPAVLILKRKAIRVYPDNQKVALYYSQALDKYVTIPFSNIQLSIDEERTVADLYSDDDKKPSKPPATKSTRPSSSKKKSGDISLTAHSAANMLRQGKVTSKQTYQKKDAEGNVTQATIDYSKLNKKKNPSVSDYASKIGGPAPVAGAIGAKIHDTIKGAVGGMMKKKRVEKALAARQAKRLAKEETQPIKAVGSVMNTSGSVVSENFRNRVKVIKEERVDEALPLVGLALGALRAAGPTIARGIARNAPRVAGAAKKVGSKALEAGKKTLRYGKKGARGVARGAARAARTAADLAEPNNQNAAGQSNKPSYKMDRNAGDYQFGLKAKTSDPFQSRRSSADTIAVRDTQLSRKASQAMLKENVIETIKNMIKNDISEEVLSFNEKEITINNTVAKKLYSIYESMNKNNRKKMEEMLNESAVTFNKVLTFAIRH